MNYEEVKAAAQDAWQEVIRHPRADLRSYLASQGVELKGGKKPSAKRCPFCEHEGSFALLPGNDGTWIYKCHYTGCASGGETGTIEKFIQVKQGVDWKEARRQLFQLTGITNPWDQWEQEKQSKATSTATPEQEPEKIEQPSPTPDESSQTLDEDEADEIPGITPPPTKPPAANLPPADDDDDEGGPEFLKIPDIGMNPYEAFWKVMTLSAAHREQLRIKRGLDTAWIKSLGMKTAHRGNRELLQPLLDKFPPNELLRAGLAERRAGDASLHVAQVLCGRIKNEEGEWVDDELIIIPYIDAKGRIINLRPHKRALSNAGFRDRSASTFYEKQHNNLQMVYGEALVQDRPTTWEYTCVLCEGEFKAMALRRCGIPAIAFPGIMFLRQNHQTRQAIEDTVALLKRCGVREVIVVFDSEDKSHKPLPEQFEAEKYARYTALTLEDHGFKTLFGVLPDEWREQGKKGAGGHVESKADWDGRLAYHIRNAKSHEAGVKAATTDFTKFLNDRSDRKGHRARVRQAPRQVDFYDIKEDIIMQGLNALRYEPKIFEGGKYEIELASEFMNWVHPKYADKLRISQLCSALRETYGGYYKAKPPSEALEKNTLSVLEKVNEELAKYDSGEVDMSEDELRQLKATKRAAQTILYRYPKAFTDFTAQSEYKVLCYEQDGTTRLDRLVVFRDKNGVKSKPFQMAGDKLNSSQELRKFFPKAGGFHWWGNQEECDFWLQHLDVKNYQRTITQIDTYGWNRDAGIYLMGDCAVADNGKFIFPDRHGIIWHKSLGYKNSETAESAGSFCHKPPMLFPDVDDPKEFYKSMDWETERMEVDDLWKQMQKDFVDAFGGLGGYACLGGLLQYLAHPELHRHLSGKPGLWIQGRKGSGKTKTIEAGMRIFGFPRNYEMISLGSTKVGIERNMSQFCGIPIHLDEWRNNLVDENLLGLVRNAYNEIGISKGTSVGTKATRKSRPSTTPIVTGEDGATDPAIRSRYLRLIMAQSQRKGSRQEQKERYFRMIEHADSYYRIGRFLFKHREEFAAKVVKLTKEFMANPDNSNRIGDDRGLEVTGVCLSALMAAHSMIDMENTDMAASPEIYEWMLKHGAESCDEIAGDVFMVRFFADCLTMIERKNNPEVEKYLRVCRGSVSENGKVNVLSDILADEGRVLVFIAPGALFEEYKVDRARSREQAPIARMNIQSELREEAAWIEYKAKPKVHRYRLPWHNKDRDQQRTFWVLDYEKCAPELKEIFRVIYQNELQKVDYVLTDDDQIQHESELKQPSLAMS